MDPITINIGNEKITQEKNAKLLGMTLADNQTWKCHIAILDNLGKSFEAQNSRQIDLSIVKKNLLSKFRKFKFCEQKYFTKKTSKVSLKESPKRSLHCLKGILTCQI